jgi:type VI secretion system protein VasJ
VDDRAMLGRITSDRRWQWAAYGKHPSVRDYFRLGQDFPMAGIFSNWIDRGHDEFAVQSNDARRQCSWRFWTGEERRDHVACGILKSSADSLERPFPLLVMGTGPMDKWVSHWDLLPCALEQAWAQIEYLATRAANGLKDLATNLQGIRPPMPDWEQLAKTRQQLEIFAASEHAELDSRIASLREEDPFLCLDGLQYDPTDLVILCHVLFRSRSSKTPNVVFLGGAVDHTYFALFRRPLRANDFNRLWSVSTTDV